MDSSKTTSIPEEKSPREEEFLTRQIFFWLLANLRGENELCMRDPDWTAELVGDVHGARGVVLPMHVSLFLSLKFSGRTLSMHLDCSRTLVPKKYFFSYHLQAPPRFLWRIILLPAIFRYA